MKIEKIILAIALVGILFSCEQKEKPQITFVVKRGTAIEVQLTANEPNTSVKIVNGKQDTTFRIGEQPTAIKYVPTATDTVTILGHITKFEYNGYMQEAMTALDVSQNTELIAISCPGNHLQTLDVSKNVALEQLDCEENHLTYLDVSKNIALKELKCSAIENDYEYCLTTLDVTNNTKLEVLFCMQHCLKELDISKNTALKRLYCTENSLKNLDVSIIQT